MREHIEYRANTTRPLLSLVSTFVAMGVFVWNLRDDGHVVWLPVLVMTPPALIELQRLFGDARLSLSPTGFVASTRFRRWPFSWTDVEGFELTKKDGKPSIVVRLRSKGACSDGSNDMVSPTEPLEVSIGNVYSEPLEVVLTALEDWHTRFAPD
jgi:hypothetical protein